MKAAVIYIEGTNCEDESQYALRQVGFNAEKVHLKQLYGDCPKGMGRRLSDYDMLMFPGGWSSGDYVRAGAIFAARLKSKIGPELEEFIQEGRFVLGVCNGFQILVEYGILPASKGIPEKAEAVLAINNPPKFQCRPVYLKHMNKCRLTEGMGEDAVLQVPVAHAEGRFTLGEKSAEMLKNLEENNQIVFKYCMPDASESTGYPYNPNGSLADIAGLSNPEGNVLGMMPHPERVLHPWQMSDYTRGEKEEGDGMQIFKSIAENIKKKI